MTLTNADAQKQLFSRLDDHISKSRRGELARSEFLTPASVACLKLRAAELRVDNSIFFFGGYDDAERKILYVLPSYLECEAGEQMNLAKLYLSEELNNSIRALKIRGSGYRRLTHRDYLGSILALGVERDALGDIVVLSDFECAVFCTEGVFNFLLGNIERIASDKVRVEEFSPPRDFSAGREFLPISDTVASGRLDCIVAALTRLSRERAQDLIRSGLCELDYISEEKCDREVMPPCVISARGYGKFNVISLDERTKKGRIRLVAEKYI